MSMKIIEEQVEDKKIFKVELDRNIPHRVDRSWRPHQMEEILRRDFDLSSYKLTEASNKICNYQSNNVGRYVFEKVKVVKPTKAVKTTKKPAKIAKKASLEE